MTTVHPYLDLGRDTEEALAFYARVLRGEVVHLIRWRDAMPNVAPDDADRVIHAEFKAGDVFFMATDAPMEPAEKGRGRISMALDFGDRTEQERVFTGLAEGGQVLAPLHDTFYGGRMGVVRDRYGVPWMLNWSPPRGA